MFRFLTTALAAALIAGGAQAGEWTASWYAAPQPTWGGDFALPTNMPAALERQTIRETARISVGGSEVRVSFSNRYGRTALTIGAAHIALNAGGDAILPRSSRPLSFAGRRSITIAPGAMATSDPLPFTVQALQKLSISTWLPQRAALDTFHWGAQQTAWVLPRNAATAAAMPCARQLHGRAFLSAIHVRGNATRATVVAFGDSITDGNGSTPDANRRWPDYLAERLAPQGIAVANAGISGARLLSDRMGVKAVERFRHDVLEQPGVQSVIILMGINDIGWPGSAFAPQDEAVTAEALIATYRQLIAMAHEQRIRVIGATLLPYEGSLHGTPFADHYTPAKDAVRRQVNDWIRNSGAFDAVADLDAATRDPAHPARMLPRYDSGDHLHPGDAGYKAIADSFNIDLVRAFVQ
jgi:lysophospholipase L1-like esterase